jgi:hypothetical protein
LPGPSREITIKIQYNFRFKNTEKWLLKSEIY